MKIQPMNKKVALNLNFGYDREKNKDVPPDYEVTANYIGYGVSMGHKEGLTSDKRRLWNRIRQLLDEAVAKKEEFVVLNTYEMAFLKMAFEKAQVPASETKNFTIVEEAILNAVDAA